MIIRLSHRSSHCSSHYKSTIVNPKPWQMEVSNPWGYPQSSVLDWVQKDLQIIHFVVPPMAMETAKSTCQVNGVSMEQLARQWLSQGGRASTSVIETCRLVHGWFGWDFVRGFSLSKLVISWNFVVI